MHAGVSEKQCCGESEDNFHTRNFHGTGWQYVCWYRALHWAVEKLLLTISKIS